MKTKPFGTTGVEVPAIGQGTWDIPESGARKTEAVRALRRGIELGMTHIDTAEMYGAGAAERIVGEAVQGIARDRLFIASKVLPSNGSYAKTIQACERSLRNLRMDYVDLYMLHWPSDVPLEETMRALAELVRSGKVRFAGISNFDAGGMLEAKDLLGGIPLACDQVLYHLRERGIEHELIAQAEQAGVAVVAYTPFGRGAFARAAGMRTLESIARKHGATVRQVILAWITRWPNVFTIPKAATVAHVEENAGAADVVLDAHDLSAIDEAFPVGAPGPLATL